MPEKTNKDLFHILLIPLLFLFVLLLAWRFLISGDIVGQGGNEELWADIYMVVALYGGCVGLVTAKYWGGLRSFMGKATAAFSIGLLLQAFGQGVYAYYAIFQGVEAAYPSIGDVGFFGSIPAYMIGVVFLAKISGVKFSFRSVKNQTIGIALPLIILGGSYFIFLSGYEFDWSNPLAVILDFAYPLGQAMYLSIAVLTLQLSKDYLGGAMKRPLLLIIFALFVQYSSDFIFLYQYNQGLYVAGGFTDALYFFAYGLMSYSLIYLGITFQKIRST